MSIDLILNPGSSPTLGLYREPQLAYVLLSASVAGASNAGARPVNWALVADASRSMRIPIVDEAQFRALIREGGAQETLVDGVPVWQLAGPVPPEVRSSASSALDQVARALHSVVERLDDHDRFALIACAEEAVLLTRSISGAARSELARGISSLKSLNLGEETDLAQGLELGLHELRRGRDGRRAERLLLLTDGFTRHPEACLRLAGVAAAEGVAISTIGLGGEFQEEVLMALADSSGGRALFLRRPQDIPRAVAAELSAARAVAARAATLRLLPASGVVARRVTRIRPALATLHEQAPDTPGEARVELHLGDLAANAPLVLLLELLAPPRAPGPASLGRAILTADDALAAEIELGAIYRAGASTPAPEVLDAAARANAARLQRRALEAASRGTIPAAIQLLQAAATRFDELGERALAEAARSQATALDRTGQTSTLATKELTYATRRLGGDEF